MTTFQKYKVSPSGDYLQVGCAEHSQPCEHRFHGFDPGMPIVEIICPTCGTSGEWKLHGYLP